MTRLDDAGTSASCVKGKGKLLMRLHGGKTGL